MNKHFIFGIISGMFLTGAFLTSSCQEKKEQGPADKAEVKTETVDGKTMQVLTVGEVIYRLVDVKGGSFSMGSNDGKESEKPVHKVSISDFSLGETEVTQALYQAVMGTNPSVQKGDDRPVTNVSWDDCQTFIQKLNAISGKQFRLPTEAEWEFAAQGGANNDQFKYAGSNSLDEVAWGRDNSQRATHPVKQKKANSIGLYDMSGNVWEWCSDFFRYRYYFDSPEKDPKGPEEKDPDVDGRVNRGGSWTNVEENLRVTDRAHCAATDQYDNTGLRLAL